jgi:hypothetical protein
MTETDSFQDVRKGLKTPAVFRSGSKEAGVEVGVLGEREGKKTGAQQDESSDGHGEKA